MAFKLSGQVQGAPKEQLKMLFMYKLQLEAQLAKIQAVLDVSEQKSLNDAVVELQTEGKIEPE